MTKLLEQTWNLNITPRKGPDGQLLIQVEELEPMTPQAFATWLHKASQDPEPSIRPASRASVAVWRDTKESPRPKAELEKMTEFSGQYKKFKRKFPGKSHEELCKMTQEWLDMKQDFLNSFADKLGDDLLASSQRRAAQVQAASSREQEPSPSSTSHTVLAPDLSPKPTGLSLWHRLQGRD